MTTQDKDASLPCADTHCGCWVSDLKCCCRCGLALDASRIVPLGERRVFLGCIPAVTAPSPEDER